MPVCACQVTTLDVPLCVQSIDSPPNFFVVELLPTGLPFQEIIIQLPRENVDVQPFEDFDFRFDHETHPG